MRTTRESQLDEIRRVARERMAELRARKKKHRICRRCKDPVELRADGEPMSACRTHLKEDAKRKRDARSLSEQCHCCGPVKHEAPTVLCAPCALVDSKNGHISPPAGPRLV